MSPNEFRLLLLAVMGSSDGDMADVMDGSGASERGEEQEQDEIEVDYDLPSLTCCGCASLNSDSCPVAKRRDPKARKKLS